MLKKTGLLKVAVVSLVLVFVVCGCKTGNGDEGLVDVSQFADLGNKGVKIAIGEPESVPAGNYAMTRSSAILSPKSPMSGQF